VLSPASIQTATAVRSTGRQAVDLACPSLPDVPRYPARFFPRRAAGLWTASSRSQPGYGCVYVVPRRSETRRPIWKAPRKAALRGPVWAPDGRSFVVAQRRVAYRLEASGRVLARFRARDVAFLADGQLLVRRAGAFGVLAGGRFDRVASLTALRRAAGFRAVFVGALAAARGYGPAVAVTWSGGPPQHRSVLLLVYPDGRVQRATPVYAGQQSMPGPPSWTPDGRVLAIPWQRAPRTGERGDHVHCLALWTSGRGYRSAGCGYRPHFDTVVWAPDGSAAVTNGSQIIDRAGRLVAHTRAKVGAAVAARWTARM
jgi:hypothetical protein